MKNFNLQLKAITICLSLTFFYSALAQDRREVGNMILEDVPEIPVEITSRIQQYQNTRSASFEDWLPNNEGILMSTRFGNTMARVDPGGSRGLHLLGGVRGESATSAGECPSARYGATLSAARRAGAAAGIGDLRRLRKTHDRTLSPAL